MTATKTVLGLHMTGCFLYTRYLMQVFASHGPHRVPVRLVLSSEPGPRACSPATITQRGGHSTDDVIFTFGVVSCP